MQQQQAKTSNGHFAHIHTKPQPRAKAVCAHALFPHRIASPFLALHRLPPLASGLRNQASQPSLCCVSCSSHCAAIFAAAILAIANSCQEQAQHLAAATLFAKHCLRFTDPVQTLASTTDSFPHPKKTRCPATTQWLLPPSITATWDRSLSIFQVRCRPNHVS